MLSFVQEGAIPMQHNAAGGDVYPTIFPTKYLRSAATSGLMDGEQLGTLNSLLTGGYKKNKPLTDPDNAYFVSNMNVIDNFLRNDYLRDMSANQLVSCKSSTIESINDALLAIHPDPGDIITKTVNGAPKQVSRYLYEAFNNERIALSRQSAVNQVNSMNKAIREMLDINTAPPRNNP